MDAECVAAARRRRRPLSAPAPRQRSAPATEGRPRWSGPTAPTAEMRRREAARRLKLEPSTRVTRDRSRQLQPPHSIHGHGVDRSEGHADEITRAEQQAGVASRPQQLVEGPGGGSKLAINLRARAQMLSARATVQAVAGPPPPPPPQGRRPRTAWQACCAGDGAVGPATEAGTSEPAARGRVCTSAPATQFGARYNSSRAQLGMLYGHTVAYRLR
jgi:hypothetical protein